jgi:hypothetical protein
VKKTIASLTLLISVAFADDATHVKSLPMAWIGMQVTNVCADHATAILDCNSPDEPFEQTIDCRAPVIIRDRCEKLIYVSERWHLLSDVIAEYAHAKSLPSAIDQPNGEPIVGLSPHPGDADLCDTCEHWSKEPTSCTRTIVGDPRSHLVWFIPCKGAPRSEPQ